MDYQALCQQIMQALQSPRDRMRLYAALAQLRSPGDLPKLLAAWNLLYPGKVLFDELERALDESEELKAWELLMGQSPLSGQLSASTTESYYNLRDSPGQEGLILGKLPGTPLTVSLHDKSVQQGGQIWYLIGFSGDDYRRLATLPANASPTARTIYNSCRAWVIDAAVTTYIPYEVLLAQIRNFEMIYRRLTLKQRITLLRQMAHPEDLPFDTVIGTSGGGLYEDTRPQVGHVYQLLKDAKATRTPAGELIDIYHFIVGLDVYQADRIGQRRVRFIDLGVSDSAATWAGDIGAGAADALLRKDQDYERANPGLSEQERLLRYYRTRAPTQDLLADIDAWAVADRVDRNAPGDTISSIIESVYGKGRETDTCAPQSRRLALQRFLKRYGLVEYNSSLISAQNQSTLQYYINDFARVWVYRSQMPRSVAFGSSYDKSELAAVSGKMAGLFLHWLDEQSRKNGLFGSSVPARGSPASARGEFSWVGKIVPWSAALRTQPRRDARSPHQGTLADLPRGTRVTVTGREGGWLHVEVTLGGRRLTGYVSQELIQRVSQ